MRNERRIKKKRRIILVTVLLISIVLVIGSLYRDNIFGKCVVEAIKVVDTLGIMRETNPINLAIHDQIVILEKENADLQLISKRKDIESQRIKDETEAKIKKNEKIAYLTFDDGPSKVVTPKVLAILENYGVKATFFVVGNMAEKNPEILKNVYEAGHTIGNHTYSHNYGYIYRNSSNFINDIEKSNEILKTILGEDFETKLIRFPGGSFGKDKTKVVKAVKDAGYDYFDWNSLNGDAEGINLSKDRLLKRLKETTQNKKEAIILMHDTDQKSTTVEALDEIIEYLIEEGYSFGVLDDIVTK